MVVYVDVDVVVDDAGAAPMGYAGADEADVTRKRYRSSLSVSSGLVSSSVV
jgi:hypothetical protein